MSTLQAFLIAVLQGATELFPISSLGHAVVVPAVLGWSLDQRAPEFLPFLVLLHTGTAVALIGYFWRDWLGLGLGVLGQGGAVRVAEARRMTLMIAIATVPAVVLGFALNAFFRSLFASPMVAAAFLAVNGLVLLFGERLRAGARGSAAQGGAAQGGAAQGGSGQGGAVQGGSGRGTKPLLHLTALDAVLIGVWQCGALVPGISRAGATMVGGLLRGLDHEASAHFSFLIAAPIIVGATVLEVPHLLHASVAPGVFGQAAAAAVVAGVVAWLSTAFLMRYFRNHDKWALNPFAYYCMAAGVAAMAFLLLR